MLKSLRARVIAQARALLDIRFVRDTLTLQAGKLVFFAINVLSGILLYRGIGAQQFGIWALVLTMYGLLLTFNLTGLGPSTATRLAEALAAGDRAEVGRVMGFFMQMSLLVAIVACGLAWLFAPAAARAAYGSPQVGELMRVYTLLLFLEPVYLLTLRALQSAQAMRDYTLLENADTTIYALLILLVVLTDGGAAEVVLAKLLNMALSAGISLWAYGRLQRQRADVLPTPGEILNAAVTTSPRGYWRFGFWLALDKNLVGLYTLLPVLLVGVVQGETEAGYLRLGLSTLAYPALLLAGVLTNLETRLPAEAGYGDYARLRANLRRLLRWLLPLSLLVYGGFALAAPLAIPLVYGQEAIPAVGGIVVLCIYGVITGVGGVFGPLYRTLRLMRGILLVKMLALALAALPALALIASAGALGGAWSVTLVYALSVGLTVLITWPRLAQLAAGAR